MSSWKSKILVVLFGTVTMVLNAQIGNRIGTWKLDVASSDFGSSPAPKSMILTIFEDSSTRIRYRVRRVNADQSRISYEWSGTKDGTPYPVHTGRGADLPAAIRSVQGDLVEHGIESNGMLESSRLSMTADGQTLTIDVHWIEFDGTEIRETWRFHRA